MEFSNYIVPVGEWAEANFGDNKGLKHFAPLTGIGEEIGELYAAEWRTWEAEGDEETMEDLVADVEDAVGDILIYLADFCYRLGIRDVESLTGVGTDPSTEYHEMQHLCLKNWQGIRGVSDEVFMERINGCVRSFCHNVYDLARSLNVDPDAALKRTWEKVSKRNWRANPKSGDGALAPVQTPC